MALAHAQLLAEGDLALKVSKHVNNPCTGWEE